MRPRLTAPRNFALQKKHCALIARTGRTVLGSRSTAPTSSSKVPSSIRWNLTPKLISITFPPFLNNQQHNYNYIHQNEPIQLISFTSLQDSRFKHPKLTLNLIIIPILQFHNYHNNLFTINHILASKKLAWSLKSQISFASNQSNLQSSTFLPFSLFSSQLSSSL